MIPILAVAGGSVLGGIVAAFGVMHAIIRHGSRDTYKQATADLLTLNCRRCNQRRRVRCTCQEDCRQPGCDPDSQRFAKADAELINKISAQLEAVARGEQSA
jgi:hypothetical protein